MDTTPVSLLERIRRPDAHEAWGRFVELYSPLLLQWARGLGLQEADAADLVQDVFAILVRVLPTFDHDREKSFRSWLRTIALNRWRDFCRRRALLPVAVGDGPLANLVESVDGRPWEEAEYRRQLLSQALQLLRADFQPLSWRAFEEHALNGRPAAEVAARLGMTMGAVYAAKFRVLARLREDLRGLLD